MPPPRDIHPIRAARQRLAPAVLAGTLALAAASSAATPGAEAYYERALMQAADARCHFFAPELGSALASAEAQARGGARSVSGKRAQAATLTACR